MQAGFVYALMAGIIPPLVWLFFWLREDSAHPEPRGMLARTFFAGMVAVVIAIPLEQYFASLNLGQSWQYISWAAVEELLKFIVVAVVALRTREYNEPIDAMIYCMTAALGFAALENTLFIMDPFAKGLLAQGIVFGNMRFMGATLVHLVSSTLVGFTLGLMFYRGKAVKFFAWAVGILAAIIIHSAFNLNIIDASSLDTLKIFAWIWGAVVIMIILFEEIKAVRPHLT